MAEFHRRNEAARLIEARAQEPVLRGVRLTAVGRVDQPTPLVLEPQDDPPAPVGHRPIWLDGEWRPDVPIYDWDALRPGGAITGPAAVQSPFTTVILRPGDATAITSGGDLLVEVAPAAGERPARRFGRGADDSLAAG